jgi:hypothetical protein
MEEQNFEKKLEEMTKPEILQLKHEDLLGKAIANAKDKSVVSLWWLCIPVFIILMLLMKSLYVPGSSLISNIHDLALRQKYITLVFFLIAPVVLIIFNLFTIRKIYFLTGSPRSANFLKFIWFNVFIIFLSVIILVVYSL